MEERLLSWLVNFYWVFQEKGQRSATDMARRNWVRQTLDREDGMLDMAERR